MVGKVAKSKLDQYHPARDSMIQTKNPDGINKDLPLNPAEQAGLREQKRNYTKKLQAPKKVDAIDPNHAYPNSNTATTLRLSKSDLNLLTLFSWDQSSIGYQMRTLVEICFNRL